jgi:predicted AlkP superfamily phosphohydrolase/phosphomutase
MKTRNDRNVLAIGLDAAEPALVQQFIDEDSMPALARLRE